MLPGGEVHGVIRRSRPWQRADGQDHLLASLKIDLPSGLDWCRIYQPLGLDWCRLRRKRVRSAMAKKQGLRWEKGRGCREQKSQDHGLEPRTVSGSLRRRKRQDRGTISSCK
jgi:hypothetical protein